jgi:hypothetical protein
MVTIEKKLVNATPRSDKYLYYSGESTNYTTKRSENQINPGDPDSIIFQVDTFSNLPTTGSEDYLYIVEDSKVIYYWDGDSSSYIAATGSVKKIVAGSNVSISPTTGTGDVTVNASVNNATLTINQGGALKGTFTANASSAVTVNLDAGGNVQPDWNQATATADDYIKNKPTIPTVPGVATTTANGLMSSTDKSKLDGIASGAEVNVQPDWNQTDDTEDDYILNKPTIPTVNDATLTIMQGSTSKGTFTSNSSTTTTISLDAPGDDNVQSNWNQTDDTEDDFIQNKPDLDRLINPPILFFDVVSGYSGYLNGNGLSDPQTPYVRVCYNQVTNTATYNFTKLPSLMDNIELTTFIKLNSGQTATLNFGFPYAFDTVYVNLSEGVYRITTIKINTTLALINMNKYTY